MSTNATFVFEGTVVTPARKGAKGDKTISVHVDRVREGGGVLADLAGQTVVVHDAPSRVTPGAALLFRTVPLTFGETVAVRAVDVASIDEPSTAGATARAIVDAAPGVEERAGDADLIVSGRVTAINDVADSPGPVSEHSPRWRDAVVQVEKVHKGSPRERTVTVRFPDSSDVRWHDAPKFAAGQSGVFLLHAGNADARDRAGERVYTALHPGDFVPASRAEDVIGILGAGRGPRPS